MLQNEIIIQLHESVSKIRSWAESLKNTDESKLKIKPSETGWSVLECIDHLNRYNEFYIPIFQKAIEKAKNKNSENYKAGWLGNKMAEDMLPRDAKLKSTMNTFKSKNPTLDGVNPNALEVFIEYQSELLLVFEKAKLIDFASTRVKTTLPLIKLKLGDALRFIINHEIRHVEQAKKALKSQN